LKFKTNVKKDFIKFFPEDQSI